MRAEDELISLPGRGRRRLQLEQEFRRHIGPDALVHDQRRAASHGAVGVARRRTELAAVVQPRVRQLQRLEVILFRPEAAPICQIIQVITIAIIRNV